jgi:catechol 2,3-dioxygenase-like lactoylglutathione lyase family enzyme
MAFHHTAFAARDLAATHRFYTEAMGFELVKAVAAPTDRPGGWAKHLFYDTGGHGLLAFWELHDERMQDCEVAISTALGYEPWVNHLAFEAHDLDGIDTARQRWLDHGFDVMEVDHGFCVSVYTMDPNDILVEWCADTAAYTDDDKRRALEILTSEAPALDEPPTPVFHSATAAPATTPA